MPPKPQWHYGGFVDFGYLLDFNHPANQIFRSRGTTWHVDDVHLNMAAAYIKKDPTDQSRWGAQLTVQGGKDSQVFGFSATAPNLPATEGCVTSARQMCHILRPWARGSRCKAESSAALLDMIRSTPRTISTTRGPGAPTSRLI